MIPRCCCRRAFILLLFVDSINKTNLTNFVRTPDIIAIGADMVVGASVIATVICPLMGYAHQKPSP